MPPKTKAKTPKAKSGTVKAKQRTVSEKSVATKGRCAGKSCSVGGCTRTYRAKNYCTWHYKEWRQGKLAKPRYTRCHDYGCYHPMAVNRHGLCEQHFQSIYVKGEAATHAPVAAPTPKSETEAA